MSAFFLGIGMVGLRPALALTIHTVYDTSVTTNAQGAQIEAAFQSAANVFQSALTNPVTVNIDVGWGEVGGTAIGSLGASGSSWYGYYSASQMDTWLRNSATSTADQTAYQHLPGAAPAGTSGYWVTSAQAKALGMISGSSTALDGYVGFGSRYAYTFNDSAGVAAGTYDFLGVAEHEISEVLGRVSGLGASGSAPSVLDMFRCTAGAPSFKYGAASYFATNGCVTNLNSFNASTSGDSGDWASTTTSADAADAFGTSGVVMGMSSTDMTLLDVVGWNTLAVSATSGGTTSGGTKTTRKGHEVSDVPEPATLPVLAAGLLVLGVIARRHSRTCSIPAV